MHKPVLLNEILEFLDPQPGKNFIDATLNGGGHTQALAERIAPSGKILGIEWDRDLAAVAKQNFDISIYRDMVTVVNDSYTNIAEIAQTHNFQADGILFDLGLSSWHYEESGRGFSFKRDEPLDMRFNTGEGVPASEIVNTYSVTELEGILKEFGEEQFSEQIAEAIGKARQDRPIVSVPALVEVISGAVPRWYKHRKIHFATKTFQALRVVVNHELENVEAGVRAAIEILKPGGKLAVISFQGHEDKIVRELFKEQVKKGIIEIPIKRTIRPVWDEQKNNPRARSAKMKVAIKK